MPTENAVDSRVIDACYSARTLWADSVERLGIPSEADFVNSAVSGIATPNTIAAISADAPKVRNAAEYPKWSTISPVAIPLNETPIPTIVAMAPWARL